MAKVMSKSAIHVSEAQAASDFPSLLARTRAKKRRYPPPASLNSFTGSTLLQP
jgi:hypothetical protein